MICQITAQQRSNSAFHSKAGEVELGSGDIMMPDTMPYDSNYQTAGFHRSTDSIHFARVTRPRDAPVILAVTRTKLSKRQNPPQLQPLPKRDPRSPPLTKIPSPTAALNMR